MNSRLVAVAVPINDVERRSGIGASRRPEASPNRDVSLTRRGRLMLVGFPVLLSAAALMTLVGFFTAPAMAGGLSDLRPTETVTVAVPGGGTLWALAAEHAPDRDPRDVVAEIVELNNLGTSTLQAGQRIFVPVSR